MADPYARLRQRIAADVARAQAEAAARKPRKPKPDRTARKGFGTNRAAASRPGEAHPQAKLTAAQVMEIRRLYSDGEKNQPALARMFGVTGEAIRDIVAGRVWRHLPVLPPPWRPPGTRWAWQREAWLAAHPPAPPAPTFGRAFAGGRSLRWPLAVATPNLSRPETPSHV